MPPRDAYQDIAVKLRLTTAALACTSRKQLCARFRAVNPATHCDLDRLHKWTQGRALPRVQSFYDDWAKVLGLSRSGAWLAACRVEDFRVELTGLDGAPMAVQMPAPAPRRRGAGVGVLGGLRVLCGSYACYSHAWSPRYRGALIRGSLVIRPGNGAKLVATYGETLVNGPIQVTGEVAVTGRSIHPLLWEPAGNLPICFSLIMPGPPVSALCGVMSGVAFVAHAALPSASRVLVVRVPPSAALDASNRYLDPSAGGLADNLAALGLHPARGAELDALAARCFAGGANQVRPADQESFTDLLDPEHFAAAMCAAPTEVLGVRRPASPLRPASER